MRVLVTGAGGYLGRALVEPFVGKHELRLMDVVPFESDHEVLVGDVADLDTVRKAVAGMEGIVIAHMASRQAGAYEMPTLPFDANVKGTANLFFAAVEQGLKRIVLVSSTGAVAGHGELEFFDRDLPPRSKTMYGLTKACQEIIAEQFQREHDLEVAALRIGWVMDADTMVSKYGDKVEHFASGLTDRRDIGEAARLALEVPGLGYEIFYVVGPREAMDTWDVAYTRERLGWIPKYDFSWLPRQQDE